MTESPLPDVMVVLARLQDQIDDLTATVEAHERRIHELERTLHDRR